MANAHRPASARCVHVTIHLWCIVRAQLNGVDATAMIRAPIAYFQAAARLAAKNESTCSKTKEMDQQCTQQTALCNVLTVQFAQDVLILSAYVLILSPYVLILPPGRFIHGLLMHHQLTDHFFQRQV